jgi:hypothetical protein
MNHKPHIAFAGFARVGKDEAGAVLVANGYKRMAFGDIIKAQLDNLIKEHFGFSAFTTNTAEKTKIRCTLESWGEDNYESILKQFMEQMSKSELPVVNTRIMRAREVIEWKKAGGVVVLVVRPGTAPFGKFETDCMMEILPLIDYTIDNDSDLTALQAKVLDLARKLEKGTI